MPTKARSTRRKSSHGGAEWSIAAAERKARRAVAQAKALGTKVKSRAGTTGKRLLSKVKRVNRRKLTAAAAAAVGIAALGAGALARRKARRRRRGLRIFR